MRTTDSQLTTATQLERIAWLSAQDKTKTFKCLMHHVNVESLRACYYQLDGRKATGVDGITKEQYGENLTANLEELITKMKTMSYRPQPVRRVTIPKPGQAGKTRALGISSFEDKLVQKQFQGILESIYEPLFLPSSYGFRRGLGCHDAIRALQTYLYKERVDTVIDVDLARYFDSIDHEELINMLSMKIEDKRFIRYLKRMFRAGVLSMGELAVSEEGVAQGSCVSPVLANIFAHYVIDEWFENTVKAHCRGKVELFRYCDDLVICCEFATDAQRVRTGLGKRLTRYGLEMNEEKTRLIRFNRNQKDGRTFNFLGFTYYWGKSVRGYRRPKVKTESKRFRTKLKDIKQWVKTVRHEAETEVIWACFCKKLQGHMQYYGVSDNGRQVNAFVYQAILIMFYWLNRRSQKQSFNWEQFLEFMRMHPVPKTKVYHRLF